MKLILCKPKFKTILFLLILVASSGHVFATSYRITGINVSSQSSTVTYGTASSTTYTLTLNESGTGSPSSTSTLSINWTTPTGVTISGLGTINLTGNGQTVTMTVTTAANTPAGTTSFYISSTNFLVNSSNANFVVSKKSATITANNSSKVYGTTQSTPVTGTTAFSVSGLVSGDSINSVTFSYSGGALSATASVGSTSSITPSAAVGGGTFLSSNYTLSYVNGTLTVVAATPTVTPTVGTYTYNAAAQGPNSATNTGTGTTYSYSYTGSGTTTYGPSATRPTNAGTYTVIATVAASGNYGTSSSVATSFTIQKALLSVTASNAAKTYGTNYSLGTTAFSSSGLVSTETIGAVTLTSTGAANTATVGSYTIMPSAATGGTFSASNYSITYTNGTLTVNTAALTVTATNASKCIGTTLTLGNTAFTASGLQNGESIGSVTLTSSGANSGASAGSYSIIPSAASGGTFTASNYGISYTNGSLTVSSNNSVGVASSSPNVCINTALTTVTHSTTGATGIGTAAGLPAGAAVAWTSNTITISGTPTSSGIFNYTIPLTGGCGTVNATGTITVNSLPAGGTLSGSANVCSTNNTTTLTLSGHTGSILKWQSCPTNSFASNVTDINNTSTTYTVYSLAATTYYRAVISNGACSTVYSSIASITITTAASGNFAYSSYGFCNSVSTAQNVASSNFTGVAGTYSSTAGLSLNSSTGAIVPSTSTARSTAYTVTYTVPATGGCPTYSTTAAVVIDAAGTGTISYTPSTICSGAAGTVSPTITGAGGTGASTWISASPLGLNINGVGDITPIGSTAGTYTITYNRSASGYCPAYSNTTTVTLTSGSSVTAGTASSAPTLCLNSALTAITHNTSGATGIGIASGLPTGVSATWASNIITINGTPTLSGTFNYTIPVIGGCGTVNATGTITVKTGSTAATITGNAAICSAGTTNLQVTIIGGTSPYTVVYSTGSVSNYSSGSNISVSSTATTTYNLISVTDANGCVGTGNTGSAVVAVDTTRSTDGGITWSNGSPSALKSVVFDGAAATINTDFSACSLRLMNNAVVTVASGFDVTLNGKLTVDSGSTFTLSNTANLIQNTTAANTGTIVVKRNSSALKRLDYTLWSSPVTGQGLYAFSPFTMPNRFYYYDTATNLFNSSVGFNLTGLQYPAPLVAPNGVNGTDTNNVQFVNGKSYLIRVPWDHPTTAAVWNGTFTGVPNNGNISFGTSVGYNAVGNPYPSRINVKDFIDGNSNVSGPLYLWRKTNGSSNASYATLTKTAFVSNGDSNSVGNGENYFNPGNESNWVLNIGQGFIIRTTGGSSITFTNSMRRNSNGDQFFRAPQTTATSATSGLFWLNLNTDTGVFSQMAVGYSSEGTLADDRGIDGKNINPDFYLTSLIGTDEYSIQGRPDFQDSDIVPLSYKVATAGNYAITIDHTTGLFSGGTQSVYLKDNTTNTVHNLNTGAYAFTSDMGTFPNRFEIIYQSLLGTQHTDFTINNVIIYNQNNALAIDSGNTTMYSVKIFDIRGRLIEEKNGINANHIIMNGKFIDEVLLIQITSESGITVTKKFLLQRMSLKKDKQAKEKTQIANDD